ncbi:MAG: APC family permease [Idiomarinaceae bacterium]|uniref:APC family permease n=1 Tax=Idiomarina sp. 28-8 TaxID=1260624 RepID=UPI000317BF08|nr:APC family permease [Idiomarina sp. 28-8]NWO01399.1 APC family permease [Idiomarinaceae bacterium]
MAEYDHEHGHQDYQEGSLSLWGAVSLGTGVMIGAGIFALTGQVAQLAREWFVLAFVCGGIIAGFSAYSYVKLAKAYPSAGGIAMFLSKAYGKGSVTAIFALLMYFSMVINESLVARTFASYTSQLISFEAQWLIPLLAVGLLIFAFFINILSNQFIQTFSFFMAFIKALGLVILAAGGLWASGIQFESISAIPEEATGGGILAGIALSILAYKGFTTITNSGGEIVEPKRNVGRAIIISLIICALIYVLVTLAVGSSLSIDEIVKAKDYALAEAAKPVYGETGLWVTVAFAIVATVSGVIASAFAVSRMLAMLTNMKLVPHSHFGMPGSIQKHTLVYTIVMAMILAAFFDLSRIASLGAIFYIVMDIAIHWGVLRHLRHKVNANSYILISAITLDVIVLAAFVWVKWTSDPLVIWASLIGMALIAAGEILFLRKKR